ncbi:MAG: hypothetical protein HOU01_09425 [Streptomycetaceae bacterium]|nr:hypothetical protein [Streptomycetaceae bacterium]
MSTPSYGQFVAAHRRELTATQVNGERVAVPDPDWIDIMIRSGVDAVLAPFRWVGRLRTGH